MKHKIMHVQYYWVEAESDAAAAIKWQEHNKINTTLWEDGDVKLYDNYIEINDQGFKD